MFCNLWLFCFSCVRFCAPPHLSLFSLLWRLIESFDPACFSRFLNPAEQCAVGRRLQNSFLTITIERRLLIRLRIVCRKFGQGLGISVSRLGDFAGSRRSEVSPRGKSHPTRLEILSCALFWPRRSNYGARSIIPTVGRLLAEVSDWWKFLIIRGSRREGDV